MISTRKRPLVLGGLLLPAVAGPKRLSRAQDATPATPARPSPPTQPITGPGGADYVYDTVIASAYREDGSRVDEAKPAIYHFWLFEPADPRPGAPAAAAPLPVVIFLPGCCDFARFAANRPDYTRSWIDHLVRRGAVVLVPQGADYIFYPDSVRRMKAAVSNALAELDSDEHVLVDLDRVAVVGVQGGGAHAVALVSAPPEGLPVPTALLLVAPFLALLASPESQAFQAIMEAIEAIPATTHVVLVGAEEIPPGDDGLDEVWEELERVNTVPPDQRACVVLRSDRHGTPSLVADQWTAQSDEQYGLPGQPDALDWYGTWKLLDALIACTFDGEFCEYVFGNTPEVRYMGTWSDGVPVKEAIVLERSDSLEATPAR